MRSPAHPDQQRGVRRTVTGVAAAALAVSALIEGARRWPALSGPGWVRRNYRGRQVSLVAGPATAFTASVVSAALVPRGIRGATLLLGLGTGAVGLYDDMAGSRPEQQRDKGFRGHLRALRSGRVSSGTVKVLGVVGVSVAAAGSVSNGPVDRLIAGGVMAGTANLVNLLDLRPGRAAKASAIAGTVLLRGIAGGTGAAVLGTSLGVLPADLGERVMLGDAGANALGAMLGLRLAAGSPPPVRAAILVALVALTAASERISFTRVIESTPGLRELDNWGRLPSLPRQP